MTRLVNWLLDLYVARVNADIDAFNASMRESRARIQAELTELERVIEQRRASR